jgi:hypothetical protein
LIATPARDSIQWLVMERPVAEAPPSAALGESVGCAFFYIVGQAGRYVFEINDDHIACQMRQSNMASSWAR